MNSLRILLVEDDPGRVQRILSLFVSSEHPPVCVPNVSEAIEALFVQKFDVALLTSAESARQLPDFASRARTAETQAGYRVAVFSCSSQRENLAQADGCLADDFTPEDVERAFAAFQGSVQSGGALHQTAVPPLATFEAAVFEEQCAHESELMVEIIGLFFDECRTELPQMGVALAEGDFEGLSRLAHKIKGSLGSLQAPLARSRAQVLETAAKDHDFVLCSETLFALEDDLSLLNRHLETFRDNCLCQ